MELDVHGEADKTVISPGERNHTLMTLLKQAIWDEGGKAGYNQGHPYEGDAGELVVDASDPQETIKAAVNALRDDLDEFRDAFESA